MRKETIMQLMKVNKDQPEQVFAICKNGESSALSGGSAVCYDYTTDADGNTVIEPTTAMLYAFAGVVANGETLGTSGNHEEYGRVQVYGHHPGVYMAGTTVTAGAIMHPVDSASYVTLGVTINDANSTALDNVMNGAKWIVAGEAACVIATSTFGNTYKAFIRAL